MNMKKKRTRRPKVSDQIRRAIKDCGLTRYRIYKETGIDQASLSKFLSGERGLSLEALDKLGELLNLKVVMHGPRRS
jgi:DNA transposition AAA+ family ATPase